VCVIVDWFTLGSSRQLLALEIFSHLEPGQELGMEWKLMCFVSRRLVIWQHGHMLWYRESTALSCLSAKLTLVKYSGDCILLVVNQLKSSLI